MCVLSLLFAFDISSVLTENFQSSLVNHDYSVTGYLLNHDDAFVLSAHAAKERQTKEFLQGIISDVSHQLKTLLSALKMYQEIIGSHTTDPEAAIAFSQKSLREINGTGTCPEDLYNIFKRFYRSRFS